MDLVLEGAAPRVWLHGHSVGENEIRNRQWGAIYRLGEARVYEAEPLIRPYLGRADPTLRGLALLVLAGEWRRDDLLGRCPDIAVDDAEDVIVRAAAVEALVKSGGAHDANLRPLLEWLAVSDDHPTSVKRAAAEAFRGSGGASP